MVLSRPIKNASDMLAGRAKATPSRGSRLAQKAKATGPAPHAAEAGGAACRGVASASQQQPIFTYAPGEAGRIALHFVEKACTRAVRSLSPASRL